MSENNLSDELGVDESAVEGLARADIRTTRELVEADAETAAAASGIPAERIREWQQRARRSGVRPGMGPVAKGWLIGAVGVVIALLLGWILMSIGSGRIQKAEQIRVSAESKLTVAVSFAAETAIDDLRQARLAIHNNNWGSAQTVLSRVDNKVTFLGRIAPDAMKSDVDGAREKLADLQQAAADQSKNTLEKIDALEAALDAMRQEE